MLDDSVIPPNSQEPKTPLWKLVRAWTIIVGLYAVLLGMAWFAVILLDAAVKPGVVWVDRAYKLLEAGALLVIPGKVAWVFIKRKLITGNWGVMTEEEKARNAARRMARQCGTVQSGACGRRCQSWIKSALSWAGYIAWEQRAGLWKRTLAWTVIVLYAAYVLGWIGFGLLCIGASFADSNTVRQQFLWVLLGLAFLIYPALVIRSYLRRIQATGNLLVSKEEFQSGVAQRVEVQSKRRQIPLRNKIISHAIGAVVLGLMWMRATVYHSRHPHESWMTPAFLTIPLLYSIWRDFSAPQKTESKASDSLSTTRD